MNKYIYVCIHAWKQIMNNKENDNVKINENIYEWDIFLHSPARSLNWEKKFKRKKNLTQIEHEGKVINQKDIYNGILSSRYSIQ